MNVLRCKTSEMVRKEILMHLMAYNCIHHLMLEAAERKGVILRLISFKGSVQALRQWEPYLNHGKDRSLLLRLLTNSIAVNLRQSVRGEVDPEQ